MLRCHCGAVITAGISVRFGNGLQPRWLQGPGLLDDVHDLVRALDHGVGLGQELVPREELLEPARDLLGLLVGPSPCCKGASLQHCLDQKGPILYF